MNRRRRGLAIGLACGLWVTGGCASVLGDNQPREASDDVPDDFGPAGGGAAAPGAETTVSAQKKWDEFFTDPDLRALIEEALENNQELNIRLQEIIIARAEASARRGEYIPKLDARAGVGIEKVGTYTSQGASDEDHGLPENLPEFNFGLAASWEADVSGRLRKARKAANYRYQASIEAKNFVVTEIVAEIANSYWDLVALDEQLKIVDKNIEIQTRALEVVKAKKAAAQDTELGVLRFQAEVQKNKGLRFDIEQAQVLTENRINYLVGRFPQPVKRNSETFLASKPEVVDTGLPSDLLENRPDVRRAELLLEAAKLDSKSAKAAFYPSLSIEAGVGYEAFNPVHLLATPESLAYNLGANLVAPLLNRAAIKAQYQAANAAQIQAVYEYERTILQAYTDVANQLNAIRNLEQRYERLMDQVKALEEAIEVAGVLYRSAHGEYMEVLMTQRDALEAQMELIETKLEQMQALVDVYQALGGGWRVQ